MNCTKEQLTGTIEEHGGQIYPDLLDTGMMADDGQMTGTLPRIILLCGEAKRTKKHLLALAMNVPRVSYRWIVDAVHTVSEQKIMRVY